MPDDTDMLDWVSQLIPWKNWHFTVSANIQGVYNLWYPADMPPYGAATINRCTRQIQRAITDAKQKGIPIRALGHGWSLSEAPTTTGALVDISRLNAMKPLRVDQLDPAYSGSVDPSALWLIQGGAYISEINRIIEGDQFRRSMFTSGAANGQTIVGATATGTHGSVLTSGALHDHIVAIHLLAGPTAQFWIERASYPVLKPNLAASLGATLIRDDSIFNAVVLGLGALGIIANVVLETRPRMLLLARNIDRDAAGNPLVLDAAMRHVIETLDFSAHPVTQSPAGLGPPYFFQPIIDATSNPPKVIVMLMYEKPWQAGYVPDYRMSASKFGPEYDFLSVVGLLLDIFQPGVAMFAQIARAELFTPGDKTGSWGELFGFKTPRTQVASGSVAVPLNRILAALDVLIALNQQMGPVPLVFGCRYVRKSKALLAKNRWDPTAVISLDGVHNQASLKFLAAIPAAMDAQGIPFTQHWGKTNGYTAARIQAMFGPITMPGSQRGISCCRTQLTGPCSATAICRPAAWPPDLLHQRPGRPATPGISTIRGIVDGAQSVADDGPSGLPRAMPLAPYPEPLRAWRMPTLRPARSMKADVGETSVAALQDTFAFFTSFDVASSVNFAILLKSDEALSSSGFYVQGNEQFPCKLQLFREFARETCRPQTGRTSTYILSAPAAS